MVQVIARLRSSASADVVFLRQGQAERYKAAGQARELLCPVPHCPAPALQARNCRGQRRDHFFHLDGVEDGGHGPESLAHLTSKYLIASRLREALPTGWTVRVDDLAMDGGERPDVCVLDPAGGVRVAYEVQFSPLSPDEWTRRHQRYFADGIVDVWLWGGEHHLRGDPPQVSPTHHALLRQAQPLLAIDPAAETISVGDGPGVREALAGGRAERAGTMQMIRTPIWECAVRKGFLQFPGRQEQHAAVQDLQSGLSDTYERLCQTLQVAPRPGQHRMVAEVARAVLSDGLALIEAPTGTGKSYAYLLPALAMGRRVLVSTSSRTLQDQLVDDDVPRIAEALGREVTARVLQGRRNYLCRKRLDEQLRQPVLDLDDGGGTGDSEALAVPALHAWAERAKHGRRRDLPMLVKDETWTKLTINSEDCPGRKSCQFGPECFAERARAEAGSAQVLVVNHDVIAYELLRGKPKLWGAEVVVIDEAHDFAGKVASAREQRLSPAYLDRFSRRLLQKDIAAGGHARRAGELLHGASLQLAEVLAAQGTGPLTMDAQLRSALAAVQIAATSASGRDVMSELQLGREESATWHRQVSRVSETAALAQLTDPTWLVYADQKESLVRAPLDVSEVLATRLLADRCVVATSATLRVGGDFASAVTRLGMGKHQARLRPPVAVESPYDYRSQCLIFIPRQGWGAGQVPHPREDSYPTYSAAVARDLVHAAGGGALVLSTSMEGCRQLAAVLRQLPLRVLEQGDDTPDALVAEFSRDTDSVLVATRTFWQGVNVPGEALRLVVMDKVPFPTPEDPVVKARQANAGDRWFQEVMLPEAATVLAQGAGRLIRSASDYGVVAVLDPRLWKPPYVPLLASLPDARRTARMADVADFYRRSRPGTHHEHPGPRR